MAWILSNKGRGRMKKGGMSSASGDDEAMGYARGCHGRLGGDRGR